MLGVAAGERHSCAIVGSEVECWGNNSYGQLGVGSTQALGGSAAPLVPVDLGGRQATAIAAGNAGAKRDVLQEVIALVRKSITDFPLQYGNFRD